MISIFIQPVECSAPDLAEDDRRMSRNLEIFVPVHLPRTVTALETLAGLLSYR